MSVHPYWQDRDVIFPSPGLYENLTGPHLFDLSQCGSFELHRCRSFLPSQWPDDQAEALKASIRQLGYQGQRFPCIGARLSDQTIRLIKGFRRIRAMADLFGEGLSPGDHIVFYLSDERVEAHWLSLIFFESQHEYNVQPFSSRREMSIPTLHRLFWSNSTFSEERFRLPSNNKVLIEKLKTICPEISERSVHFWKTTRFISSDVIQALEDKAFRLTNENLRKFVSKIIHPACQLSSTFRHISGFDQINLLERIDRSKRFLIEGNAWRTLGLG